jgi:hypothetical protein
VITKSVPARCGTRTFATAVGYITREHHEPERTDVGRSFQSGVEYATAPEKAAWIHLRGVISLETAWLEMEAVAALSRRCKDPVYHLIVAYAKHEHPTRAQMVSDAERLLKALGMGENQYVLAAHMNTDDLHAHVIANRIGPSGRANDLWHERIIRERISAEIAAERGWEIVVGRHNRDIVQRVRQLHELPTAPVRRLRDGEYRRLHDRGELPWQDVARPYVLDAVDRAVDWSDLHRRLGEHGVVVKLVERGGRVQGLAFAEGRDASAPGCGASRVDDRCKLRALEARLGPFPRTTLAGQERTPRHKERDHQQGRERIDEPRADRTVAGSNKDELHRPRQRQRQRLWEPGTLRASASADAARGPQWALKRAQGIAEHAKLRADYHTYRERFFGPRSIQTRRREAAWEREREQRRVETQRRWEARRLLRAVVRVATRGVARQIAYWAIDSVTDRRRAQEWAAARTRWEATKVVFAAEQRMERPMTYRDFAVARAAAGDRVAANVTSQLLGVTGGSRQVPSRGESASVPAHQRDDLIRPQRSMPIGELRSRLEQIAKDASELYEEAKTRRQGLERIAPAPKLEDLLSAERAALRAKIARETDFTDAERKQLVELRARQRSWNPIARNAAKAQQQQMLEAHDKRRDNALQLAQEEFEKKRVPHVQRDHVALERRYQDYVRASLGYEDQMRDARETLRRSLPDISNRIEVLERAGVASLESVSPTTDCAGITRAVEAAHRSLSEETAKVIETNLRRERNRDRLRGMEIDR